MSDKKRYNAVFRADVDELLNEIDGGNSKANQIKVSEIRPNPYQPRTNFDPTALEELSNSIKEHGIFTPLLVRKAINGYELIAGERRLRAAKLAKLQEVPCIISEFSDNEMMEISILENIQREDLSPIEEAKAYEQLQTKLSYTQEMLAKRIGKSRAYITNSLRLLKLPNKVQELVQKGKISSGHARALAGLDDEDKINALAKKIVDEGLSVREIEKIISGSKTKATPSKPKTKDAYLNNVKEIMETRLDTKVDVKNNRIVIHYKSTRDLNRILDLIDCLDN